MSNAENSPHTLGEHRVWIQRLLARYCLLQYRLMKLQPPSLHELIASSSPITFTSVLTPFRAWAEFWKTSSHQAPKVTKFCSDRGDVSQRLVWHAYYDTISIFVRIRSLYAPSSKGAQNSELQAAQYDISFFSEPRSQQCMELKQVQSIYEGFLINELSFPKANEATPEIEIWVDQVVDNWKIICGPTWRNEDHIGGKEVTTRVVLEVSGPVLQSEVETCTYFDDMRVVLMAIFVPDSLPSVDEKFPLDSNTKALVYCPQFSRRVRSWEESARYIF